MRHCLSLLSAVFVFSLLGSGCAGPPAPHKALKRTIFNQGEARPKLFIVPERDRSGGRYLKLLDEYDMESFQERFTSVLLQSRIRFSSFTEYGEPYQAKLDNPFDIVGDSTEADLVLELYVDGFEDSEVEVTGDRIAFWNGFGITQFTNYERVPRVLVALSARLRDPKTRMAVYEFKARGVSVNRPFKREGYQVALNRCEQRFYERLLAR